MKKLLIYSLPFLAAVINLTGCLKGDDTNLDIDKTNSVTEFANTGTPSYLGDYLKFASDLGTLNVGDTGTFNVNISYSGADMAPEDITVSLVTDSSLIEGSTYEMPPAELYVLPATAVIKKGMQVAQVQVKIVRTEAYNFDANYALPLRIAATSHGIIGGNFGVAVYSFAVRNAFDGVYSMKGYSLRGGDATLTGHFAPIEMELQTYGAKSVIFGALQVWANGSGVGVGNPVLDVETNNTDTYPVTVSSSGGAYNDPNYTSTYDVATKTFYISFTWGAGPSARLATDTLTYLRAR